MTKRPGNLGQSKMWQISTYWFDLTIVFAIFAVGNILFGHFEEHRPKWRRLAKVAVVLALSLVLSYLGLRWLFFLIVLALLAAASYIHVVWLPKNGINGWTGEPREEYLKLVSGNKQTPDEK